MVLARLVATVVGAVSLVFVLLVAAPGDPIDLLPNGAEMRPHLEAAWALDKPAPERLVRYLAATATGDLGTSLTYRPGVPVTSLLARPAFRSATILLPALLLALALATALALLERPRSRWTRGAMQALSVVPAFLMAHLLVAGLNQAAWSAIQAGWIGRPGWFALPDEASPLRATLAVCVLAVGSGALSGLFAELDSAVRGIRMSGYVEAARARGASVAPHLIRNIVPALTAGAMERAAFFAGGLVVVERVLLVEGVGTLLWRAAELRDYDLAMGIAIVFAVVVAFAHALGDLLRMAIDPRGGRGWG